MTSNCLIDGKMTAFFKNEFEFYGKTPSYQDSIIISSIRHSRTLEITLRGCVLYCSEHRFCKAKTDGGNAEGAKPL